jgi:2-oxo-4-hydroxy-4-carboxy-5-ureidoimidazoline decarboxylase
VSEPVSIADFDAAPVPDAAAELYACCASKRWIAAVLAARPYRGLAPLAATSDRVIKHLAWPDVEEALAAHPRIGERVTGEGREATWSRQEQSGSRLADVDTDTALREGNVVYEQRFGHVFLICASGLSAGEMLDALRSRLTNPMEVERDVVRAELAKIVRLRLGKAFT